MKELFSERLKSYRDLRGLTMEAMGKRLGVSGRYIAMLEKGVKKVEADSSIVKLFDLLSSASPAASNTVREESPPYSPAPNAEPIPGHQTTLARLEAFAKRTGIPAIDIGDIAIRKYLDSVDQNQKSNR